MQDKAKTKKQPSEYVFKINAYSISTMPMNRLAEYMQDIATLMGEHKSVHFSKLKSGSIAVAMRIDNEAEPKVRERIRRSRTDDAADDARNAIRRINKHLAEDNASGDLIDPNNYKIIQFPGKKKYSQRIIGPIRQPGTLDGTPIRIGGKGDAVPVHLVSPEQKTYICDARRDIAKQIAQHMFENLIRVDGMGAWTRGPDGEWEMDSFRIQEFQVLEETSLIETVHHLRAIDLPLDPDEDLSKTMAEIRNGP